jgi:uncharacterized damage-inducible protein DinB
MRRSPYLIGEQIGFTPQIGHLVSMLTYVRQTTLDTVADLTTEQLDYLHDHKSNSIGALLAHVAAVEVAYQAATFEARGLDERERSTWGAALDLGKRAQREIRGRSLQQYVDAMTEVREKTLRELSNRTDHWLYEESPFWGGLPANNYFQWFHVFEDELNHRGQMRWLRKRLP